MTTLAKLYILHEMQNPETGIFYEAYFGDRQYTMSDPVSQYLDINHPRIVKAKDLEEHKLQHDTNVLEYFGKDNGMLYEENYNAYVLGALHDKQIIKLKNPYQKINGISYTEARDILIQRGWNFTTNPSDENYLIMLFNSHDPMGKTHITVENSLKKLLETNIYGFHDRNNLLREIYNDEIVENIDRYLFDLTTELNAMMGVDVSSILSPEEEAARYKQKNESSRRITTGDDNAISRAQAEVKKQLNKIPATDEASRVVLGKYSEELLKPNATIEDIRRIGKKAENKSIKKEIEALKKSRVFARVIKNNPKKYQAIWKNIVKAADELKETNSEFLSVMTNAGSMSDYVLNKKDTVNRQNDPDHYKESYKRLSQIITLQIISENDEFARGVILESLDKKASTRSVINELQNVVEKFLMEDKTLEGRGFSKNKLENGLRSESLKKDIVTSIVKMSTKKPEKKTETNIHKTNDSKTVSNNIKKNRNCKRALSHT